MQTTNVRDAQFLQCPGPADGPVKALRRNTPERATISKKGARSQPEIGLAESISLMLLIHLVYCSKVLLQVGVEEGRVHGYKCQLSEFPSHAV